MPNFPPHQKSMTQTRAVIELVFAAMMWGMGFVAAMWALRDAGPLAISGWRFVVAGLTGLLFARRFLLTKEARLYLRYAWAPGALIAATIVFQTWGLQYTTATKSGFLTCLYVLIVPLFEATRGRGTEKPLTLIICSAIALLGVGLMCGLASPQSLDDRARLNIGDFLTLICAFAASAHILVTAGLQKRLGEGFNGFHFNSAQSLAAGFPTLFLALLIEPGTFNMPLRLAQRALSESALPLLGFLSLAFFSTLIGFALQVRAQRVLTPSTASLLFLLESPFAALFAFLFLKEEMGPIQLLGGIMILGAVAFSTMQAIRASPSQN
jgi:drug/metabolite transporter (DMT)-like permease